MSEQKTLSEFYIVESYIWTGGNLTLMDPETRKNYKNKLCILCGVIKNLTHERVSGGQKTRICSSCAWVYIKNAEQTKVHYGDIGV
jgi:hypothetical protein